MKPMASINFRGEKISFFPSTYKADGSKAIVAYANGEIYGVVTINLSEHNVDLDEDEVVIDHDVLVLDDFVDKMFAVLANQNSTRTPIAYGFAHSFIMQLRPELLDYWKKE